MMLYDKETELRYTKSGEELLQMTKGILRFEAKVTTYDLRAYCNDRDAEKLINERAARYFLIY